MTLWHSYWAWAGGNIGAMPLQAAITAVAGFLFRNPLGRLLARAAGRDALAEAKAARKIAADLYRHHTGRAHPDAPAPEPESEAK